jgi:mannose-6-phosphate isomerase-like protein (cupin superfamily)
MTSKPRIALALLALLFAATVTVHTLRASAATNQAATSTKTPKTTKANPPARNVFTPDEMPWGPAPAFLNTGAQLAVIEGNPMGATGDYTVRLKMPDGYKIAPHSHPLRENVTIISGALKVGMGDTFDESKMKTLGVGSFAYMNPNIHHYVLTSGETIIQIHGGSPLKLNYVSPADDPSAAK